MEDKQVSFSHEQQQAYYDYLQWLEWAKDNGVVSNALLNYYSDAGSPLYRIMLNGREIEFPILTRRDWVGLDGSLNDFIGEISEESYTEHSDEAIENIAKEMYVRQQGLQRRGEPSFFKVGDVLWNDPTYRITDLDTRGGPTVDLGRTDFYTYVSKAERFLRELHHALQEENVTAQEARRTDLSHQLSTRNKHARTFNDITQLDEHAHKIGPACLLAVEQNSGGPLLYFIERSEDVLHTPGTSSVVPAGEANPDEDDGADLERTIIRELAEELLGVTTSADPNRPGTDELTERVAEHVDDGTISITRTGFGFTLGAPRPAFTGLIHVADPEIGEWMVEQIETNWEIEKLDSVQLPLRQVPEEMVPPRVSPTGGMAFFEGLARLEENGVRTGVQISRLF